MKKIVDLSLLAKLDGKKSAPVPRKPKAITEPKIVTDEELIGKLEQDNKRLSTVNQLLNNSIDVKVVEVPFKVHVPVEKIVKVEVPVEKIVEKEVIKEVIKEIPVDKIVEKVVHKYVEVPVAIQQPKQNVNRSATEKVTIKNSRISTLKKLDDILRK
jgi:hypothetical protein